MLEYAQPSLRYEIGKFLAVYEDQTLLWHREMTWRPSEDLVTLMDMHLERQLKTVAASFTPSLQPLPWLLQIPSFQAPATDAPETSFAREDQTLDAHSDMAQDYLSDLESSIRVQQKLLTEQPTAPPGAEIAVHYLPMMAVSGDYYDLLTLHEGQVGLAIGDVCGKGIEAAMLMASVCTTLQAHVQADPTAIGELLTHLNQVTYRDTARHQFVTLTYGIWDASDHMFTYSSAGHLPVLHYQASTGCVNELNVGGMVLGVCEETEYPTESVSLGMGDALVMYTDGITEASNASDEAFGIDRLGKVVAAHGEKPPEALATAILDAASQFAHQRWEDDVTLMVVKRTSA